MDGSGKSWLWAGVCPTIQPMPPLNWPLTIGHWSVVLVDMLLDVGVNYEAVIEL